jgi:hypothetical protein
VFASCSRTPGRDNALPPGGDGYMIDDDGSGVFGDGTDVCMPPCADSASAADSCSGWGYEDGLNCTVPGSIAAAQTVPCVYEALTTDPPPGTGWDGDYITTCFGEVDCRSLDR